MRCPFTCLSQATREHLHSHYIGFIATYFMVCFTYLISSKLIIHLINYNASCRAIVETFMSFCVIDLVNCQLSRDSPHICTIYENRIV